MRALVVYESMYGNTRRVAEAICEGLRSSGTDAVAAPVAEAPSRLAEFGCVVVGGPTHAWSMSRASTRRSAVEAAAKPTSQLQVEPGADGLGLREWLDGVDALATCVAAFDTRMKAPWCLTGRASRAIARRLRKRGADVVRPPRSFFVHRDNTLVEGQLADAREWGDWLARRYCSQPVS